MAKYRTFIGWEDGRHVKARGFHFQREAKTITGAWAAAQELADHFNVNPYVVGRAYLIGNKRAIRVNELDEAPTPIGYVALSNLGVKIYLQRLDRS
jgi:hypothetical protein